MSYIPPAQGPSALRRVGMALGMVACCIVPMLLFAGAVSLNVGASVAVGIVAVLAGLMILRHRPPGR